VFAISAVTVTGTILYSVYRRQWSYLLIISNTVWTDNCSPVTTWHDMMSLTLRPFMFWVLTQNRNSKPNPNPIH